MSKSTPPSPVEKISTSEIVDTEEEVQFKRPIKRTLKEKLQAKDDSRRYKLFARCSGCSLDSISRRG